MNKFALALDIGTPNYAPSIYTEEHIAFVFHLSVCPFVYIVVG